MAEQLVTCPSCSQRVDINKAYAACTDALLVQDGIPPRRVSRFVNCACGALLTVRAWEGWERWYFTTWSEAGADVGKPQRGPDYDAYYERERTQKATP